MFIQKVQGRNNVWQNGYNTFHLFVSHQTQTAQLQQTGHRGPERVFLLPPVQPLSQWRSQRRTCQTMWNHCLSGKLVKKKQTTEAKFCVFCAVAGKVSTQQSFPHVVTPQRAQRYHLQPWIGVSCSVLELLMLLRVPVKYSNQTSWPAYWITASCRSCSLSAGWIKCTFSWWEAVLVNIMETYHLPWMSCKC